jgi:hypothetical protein
MNTAIPLASDVPGLADFLSTTFTTAPAAAAPAATPTPTPTPTATPTPTPTPTAAPVAPRVSSLGMNPDPVKVTGTAAFSLSAPASVTVRILTGKGALVRTLLSGVATAAGSGSVTWDRKDASGRRVGKGTYSVRVDAVDASGQLASASAPFAVSS